MYCGTVRILLVLTILTCANFSSAFMWPFAKKSGPDKPKTIDSTKGQWTGRCTKTSDCKDPRLTCIPYGHGPNPVKLCVNCKTEHWAAAQCAVANPPSYFPYWLMASLIVVFALVTAFVWFFDSLYPTYKMQKAKEGEKGKKAEIWKKQKEDYGGGDGNFHESLPTPMPDEHSGSIFPDNEFRNRVTANRKIT